MATIGHLAAVITFYDRAATPVGGVGLHTGGVAGQGLVGVVVGVAGGQLRAEPHAGHLLLSRVTEDRWNGLDAAAGDEQLMVAAQLLPAPATNHPATISPANHSRRHPVLAPHWQRGARLARRGQPTRAEKFVMQQAGWAGLAGCFV